MLTSDVIGMLLNNANVILIIRVSVLLLISNAL